MPTSYSRFLIVLGTTGALSCSGAPDDIHGAQHARAVEERLIAPCCWVQTLDVHESETATNLRTEIRQRLERGESGASIEDDLAARYGEKIRAVPKGKDPRRIIPFITAIATLSSLVGLGFVLRKWLRRGQTNLAQPALATGTTLVPVDDYETRLDDELARFEDS